jgi:hypothetical protein
VGGDQIKPPWVGEADKEGRKRSGGKGEGRCGTGRWQAGPAVRGLGSRVRASSLPYLPARRRPGNVITRLPIDKA